MGENVNFKYFPKDSQCFLTTYSPSQVTPFILANPLGQAVSVRMKDTFFFTLEKKIQLS